MRMVRSAQTVRLRCWPNVELWTFVRSRLNRAKRHTPASRRRGNGTHSLAVRRAVCEHL